MLSNWTTPQQLTLEHAGEGRRQGIGGNALSDAKLTAEGRSDRAKRKLQSAIGGLKDALKKKQPYVRIRTHSDAVDVE